MKWIHISDIHFNFENYDTDELREKLLSRLEEETDIDFILITGDVTYKYGENEDEDKCVRIINDIVAACNGDDVKLYLCPGNHDVNREDGARNKLIDKIRGQELVMNRASANQLVNLGHEKFKLIYQRVKGNNYNSFEVFENHEDGKKYRIISLDTSLLAKDKDDEGRISLQTHNLLNLKSQIHDDDYLNIVIMHHGIEFFERKAGKAFQHWIEDHKIDVVFCGHSHQAGIRTYDETRCGVKQFTCGAGLIDDYAIPSFYVCNFDERTWTIESALYTFQQNGDWGLDNHNLRAFEEGINTYYVPRKHQRICGERAEDDVENEYRVDQIVDIEKAFFRRLNERVYNIYGREIRSSNLDNIEEFSVNKIYKSLIKIGIPTDKIMILLEEVVNEITLSSFYEPRHRFISTGDIRTCVYNRICNMSIDGDISDYDINNWAGKYARRYGHNNKRMCLVMLDGREEPLSYSFVLKDLLKDVMEKVTGCSEYYESMLRNELNYMAEEVMQFLKGLSLYCVNYDILVDFTAEMVTQTPHPWLISKFTRETIISYHQKTLQNHMNNLKGTKKNTTVLETLYHATAVILCYYTLVIGCTETSPINNLTYSLNRICTSEKTPIKKRKLLELENDLVRCGFEWSKFCMLINEIYADAVTNHDFWGDRINNNVITLSDIALSLISFHELSKDIDQTPIEKVASLFKVKEGFVTKKPLLELNYCFWVTPDWSEAECEEYDLKKQMLVLVIKDKIEDENALLKYLELKVHQCNDLIFFKENLSGFTNQEKEEIKFIIGRWNFRCIFFDERKLKNLEGRSNLREELLHIISST